MTSDNNHNQESHFTHTKVFVCSDAIILGILIFILNNLMFNKFLTVSRIRTEL
jgi:hypothetical protein